MQSYRLTEFKYHSHRLGMLNCIRSVSVHWILNVQSSFYVHIFKSSTDWQMFCVIDRPNGNGHFVSIVFIVEIVFSLFIFHWKKPRNWKSQFYIYSAFCLLSLDSLIAVNGMVNMEKSEDQDRKIVLEFCHLLEKSKQLFNGLRWVICLGCKYHCNSNKLFLISLLQCAISTNKIPIFSISCRDLPQYGHRQWQAYFGRTFDVYTKLWKFQQQHRLVLDSKYGLKRWQIGEIASKIGQLYYHY